RVSARKPRFMACRRRAKGESVPFTASPRPSPRSPRRSPLEPPRELQRAGIDLAPRQAGVGGDASPAFLERMALERLHETLIEIVHLFCRRSLFTGATDHHHDFALGGRRLRIGFWELGGGG